jgi:hypothetical protein
MRIDI